MKTTIEKLWDRIPCCPQIDDLPLQVLYDLERKIREDAAPGAAHWEGEAAKLLALPEDEFLRQVTRSDETLSALTV